MRCRVSASVVSAVMVLAACSGDSDGYEVVKISDTEYCEHVELDAEAIAECALPQAQAMNARVAQICDAGGVDEVEVDLVIMTPSEDDFRDTLSFRCDDPSWRQ